jgi:hypothetical protein
LVRFPTKDGGDIFLHSFVIHLPDVHS